MLRCYATLCCTLFRYVTLRSTMSRACDRIGLRITPPGARGQGPTAPTQPAGGGLGRCEAQGHAHARTGRWPAGACDGPSDPMVAFFRWVERGLRTRHLRGSAHTHTSACTEAHATVLCHIANAMRAQIMHSYTSEATLKKSNEQA